jgi:hypothetical protein
VVRPVVRDFWVVTDIRCAVRAFSGQFAGWNRVVATISAAGHLVVAFAILFCADMPHSGAASIDLAPLLSAVSRLLYWAMMVG